MRQHTHLTAVRSLPAAGADGSLPASGAARAACSLPASGRDVPAACRAVPAGGTGRPRRCLGRALAVAAATLALATTPALAAPPAEPEAAPRLGACGPGQLCLWQGGGFSGERHVYELTDTGIESCVALPDGVSAGALANRTGRPVTAYQSRVCAEEGEFHTHPSGSWSPRTPYAVRAVKVWER